jgi:lipoprotein-anchoring transpeptidase ErfK/SrfK
MSLFERYRAHRDDPYCGYYPSGAAWRTPIAIGLPLLIVLVLALSFALAAIRPASGQPARAGHLGGPGYQSLLIPNDQAEATFQAGRAQQVNKAQRVVMGSEPTPGQTAAATPHLRSKHGGSYRTDENGYRIAPAADSALVPYTTRVAHLEHTTKGYPGRNAFSSNRKVPGSWYGYPSILPIIDSTPDRLKVMLAQRPDESTSWIKRSAAVITRIHYAVVVDLSQHWLYVFYKGIQVSSFPVGVGASGTPTPTGNYFVAFHAPPNGPGYGSFMLETSAHSRVIAHFEGGDDAIIAIHGPVGSDAQIGTRGAAISNGCIRMHNADLRQIRHVHNGAPVFLTY